MRTRSAVLVVLLSGALVVGACDQAVPTRPPDQQLDTVGTLADMSVGEDRAWYNLADGTTWSRPTDQFRVLYDLPSRTTLFVAGIDGQGEYVLLIGGMDGLPEDCPYALRYGGREWGDAIEAQGLLWPKANGFRALNGSSPAVGEEYPGDPGFCLDDQARVTSVYVVVPPSDPSTDQPAGSAAAP